MSAPGRPGMLSAADAVDVLACTQEELERWKRAVLPTGPRKRAGQADDEYRADEVIAVAVGQWLEGLKRREALALAARLVGNLPDEGSWCVLVTYRTVQLITDPASPELAKRRKVREGVFHPDGLYRALRARGVWPPASSAAAR